MVNVVKSEWHQVEKRYGIVIDEDIIAEIYPDLDEEEIAEIMTELENGDRDITEIIDASWENDVDLNWEYLNEDDWWTDRKGGYDVTYSAEDWEVRQEYVSPTIWKCTKCKWQGDKWASDTVYHREDGTIIEDYFQSEEEKHHTSESCPMCDSPVDYIDEETRLKIEQEEREQAERYAQWDKEGEFEKLMEKDNGKDNNA
jgi:Zn finger protein HypA/HybF involved in hydrogenase expression